MLKFLLIFISFSTYSAYVDEDDQDLNYIKKISEEDANRLENIIDKTNQQYLKNTKIKFSYKYLIDYYISKGLSWLIIAHKFAHPKEEGISTYQTIQSTKKNYTQLYIYIISESMPFLADLWYITPYSFTGEALKSPFLLINFGLSIYNGENYMMDIGLILLNIFNLLIIKKIQRIQQTPDLYILQNIKLNENFPRKAIDL